jgi:hypothetical protein
MTCPCTSLATRTGYLITLSQQLIHVRHCLRGPRLGERLQIPISYHEVLYFDKVTFTLFPGYTYKLVYNNVCTLIRVSVNQESGIQNTDIPGTCISGILCYHCVFLFSSRVLKVLEWNLLWEKQALDCGLDKIRVYWTMYLIPPGSIVLIHWNIYFYQTTV